MISDCDSNYHPVHAFRPERRRHLVEADMAKVALKNGWIE